MQGVTFYSIPHPVGNIFPALCPDLVGKLGAGSIFPLTPVSPDCDIQPRSAIMCTKPGEEEAVEKFNTDTQGRRRAAAARMTACVRN